MYRRNEKIERIRDEMAEWQSTEYRKFEVPFEDTTITVTLHTAAEPRLAMLEWPGETVAFWVNDLGRTRMISTEHDYGHYENLKQALSMVLPRGTRRIECCPNCGGTEWTQGNDWCMPCCAGEKGVDW